jgi:fatty acid synthase, animal type
MQELINSSVKRKSVVISGISGRFPKSRNLREFSYNLFNKIDMIGNDQSRWKHFNTEIPKQFGKISDLEKFDASFFSYLDKHAAITDPQTRIILEHSYEAILDAGVSPQSLFGSRTGVFVACMMLDSKDAFLHDIATKESQGGSFVRYFQTL